MNMISSNSLRTFHIQSAVLIAGLAFLTSASSVSAQPTPAKATDSALPPGIKISGARNPLMDIEQPLITADEVNAFRRKQSEYIQTLRAGEINPKSTELVKEAIRVRLYEMTIPDRSSNLNSITRTFMRDIQAHAGAQQINPRLKRKFREMFLEESLIVLKELLSNNLQVRLKAAVIAGNLNIVEEDRGSQTKAEPYEPALDFLNEILSDQAQADVVKIAAVQGIMRLMTSEQLKLSRNDRLQTAELMAAELKRAETYYWYQVKLIQGLDATDMDIDRSGAPFIVEGLAQVMGDAKRDPRVRSKAAFTLPRVPIPQNLNLTVLAWQTAKLTEELAQLYNQNPEQIYWTSCFLNLYGAFKPINSTSDQENGYVALTSQAAYTAHQQAVADTYAQVIPVIKGVWDNQGGAKLRADIIVPLTDWIKANDPGESSIYPGGPTAAKLTKNDTAPNAGP